MSGLALARRADLARGGAVGLIGSATGAVLGLALVVVLGRLLGDAGAGVVLQAIAILTIVLGFARLGMDSAALWALPPLVDDRPRTLRAATTMLIALSGMGGAVCAVPLAIASTRLAEGDRGSEVAAAVAGSAWSIPFLSMLLTALACTRALGGVVPFTLIGGVGLPAVRPIAVASAAGLGGGFGAVVLAWAAPAVIALAAAVIVLAVQLRHHVGAAPATGLRGTHLPARIAGYAAPRVVSESLSQLLSWCDVIVVGAIAGPAAAGVYGAATRLAAAGTIVDAAIRVVVSPVFSRLLHRGDRTGVVDVFRASTTWLVLFSTPVYLLLAVFAPVVLSIMGPDFVDGRAALAVLCVGAVVAFLAGNIHSVLLMSGRSGLAAANKAVAVAVDIGLLVALVPAWGIAGAAAAWAAACIVDAALATFQVRVVLRLPLPLSVGLLPLAMALVTVGGASAIARLLLGATWLGLAVAAVVGGGALLAWAHGSSARLHLDAFAAIARPRRHPSGGPS